MPETVYSEAASWEFYSSSYGVWFELLALDVPQDKLSEDDHNKITA